MRPAPLLLLFFLCASLLQAADAAPGTTTVPGNDPHVVFMGRTELAGSKVRMAYPAVALRFSYRGPAPTLVLSADSPTCFFNLSCNGWDPVVLHLKQGENRIPLPTGIAPASGWVIELVRRTESWMGAASFDGLVLPEGCELLAAPAWPERKLMFIGDSLTCGEYLERFPPEDDSTPRSTNAARSYGMLLARWLGAQAHLISYGGRGLIRDWSGNPDVNTVPVFFPRALPDDPASRWDHARYSPDVIVINDGTDYDAGMLDDATMTAAFAKFVGQVRAVHPHAFILLAESGLLSDGSNGKPRVTRDALWRVMNAVAAQRKTAGDDRIRVVHSGYHPGTATDGHLVAFQHEQIALDLLGAIREVTGW